MLFVCVHVINALLYFTITCVYSHTHTVSIGTEIVEKQEAARKQN